MKFDDCKKCKYHYKAEFDDVLCKFNGGFDYRVVAADKKGIPMVVMCPLENVAVPKKDLFSANNFRSLMHIS